MPKPVVSPAREYAFQVLQAVFTDESLLDEALEERSPSSIKDNDRALAREIVAGTCRHLGKIRYTLMQFAKQFDAFPPEVHRILELSVYQLLYLDRVPEFAVVSDAVNLAKNKKMAGLSKAVNGILRNLLRQKDTLPYPKASGDFYHYIEVEYSHPRWLIKEWQPYWDSASIEEMCAFNNTRAPLSLRVRCDIEQAKAYLTSNNIAFKEHAVLPNIITITEKTEHDSSIYQNKMWVVQDPVMSLPTLVMNPQPGWKVWDVCAAPGGKTFHIVDKMQDKGTIYAGDRSSIRLERLKEQQVFLGHSCIQPLVLNPLHDKLPPEMADFDAILLDVPCTGLGTFRRNPDLRWRLTPDDSRRSGKKALQLLQRAAQSVKLGGIVVYSTCTISPHENEKVIERFIRESGSFELEELSAVIPAAWHGGLRQIEDSNGQCFTAYPHQTKTDGAFIALLRRNR